MEENGEKETGYRDERWGQYIDDAEWIGIVASALEVGVTKRARRENRPSRVARVVVRCVRRNTKRQNCTFGRSQTSAASELASERNSSSSAATREAAGKSSRRRVAMSPSGLPDGAAAGSVRSALAVCTHVTEVAGKTLMHEMKKKGDAGRRSQTSAASE